MTTTAIPDTGFWRGRRVLVTGHSGFKGAWLTLWLSRLGATVSGLALPPPTEPSLFALAGGAMLATTRWTDVRDAAAVAETLRAAEPEVLIHMAAQALVRPSYRDPAATYATNVMGTVHVLDAARACPSVRAVVVVTSDKCYENREWVWPYREDEPMGGHDPYSNSKGCAELVVAAYRRSFFAPEGRCAVASARAGNVIGGGDWSEDRLVPDLMRAFASGAPAVIRNPRATRPWQHVLEPLWGYLLLAERLCGPDGAAVAEGWNFGPPDEDCRPVSHLADRLAAAWGEGAGWRLDDGAQPHEAHLLKVDASKARARLGWRPRLGLDAALDWTAAWHRDLRAGRDAAALCLDQIAAWEALAPGGAAA